MLNKKYQSSVTVTGNNLQRLLPSGSQNRTIISRIQLQPMIKMRTKKKKWFLALKKIKQLTGSPLTFFLLLVVTHVVTIMGDPRCIHRASAS